MGIFAQIMEGLAAKAPDNKTISIDATYLKAHRTASSLAVKKGGVDAWLVVPKLRWTRSCTPNRHDWATNPVFHDRRSSQWLHWGKSNGEQLASGRLAACGDPLWPMSESFHICNSSRGNCSILVMRPEPRKAQILIERWRHLYNTVRPHCALWYRPLASESIITVDQNPTIH